MPANLRIEAGFAPKVGAGDFGGNERLAGFGAPSYAGAGEGWRPGVAAFVGVSTPLKHWISFGVEAGYDQFGAVIDNSWGYGALATYRTSRLLTFSTVSRLTLPVVNSWTPFVAFEGGVGHLDWSDGVSAPRDAWGAVGAMGLGLRYLLPRPWPSVQAEVRGQVFLASQPRALAMPRVVLSY